MARAVIGKTVAIIVNCQIVHFICIIIIVHVPSDLLRRDIQHLCICLSTYQHISMGGVCSDVFWSGNDGIMSLHVWYHRAETAQYFYRTALMTKVEMNSADIPMHMFSDDGICNYLQLYITPSYCTLPKVTQTISFSSFYCQHKHLFRGIF